MSSSERFYAALRREKSDRIPISLWWHAYNLSAGIGFKEFARNGEKMAESHLAFLSKFKVDFLKVTPCGAYFVEDWGGKLEYLEEEASVRITDYPVKTTEDWEKLEVLDPKRARLHREQLKCLRVIKNKIGKTIPFLETIFNPLTTATKLAGDHQVFSDMRENPSALKRGLQTITETLSDFAQACLDEGAAGIFYSIKTGSADTITPHQFDEFNIPYDMKLMDAMKEAEVRMLHLHSEKPGAELLIDKMSSYPVNAINWWDKGTTLSLRKAKDSLSKKFCLVAGLDHVGTLLKGPDEVEREVKAAIEMAAQGGGFMLGPGCTMNAKTSERNIAAALNAATKYGKY